MTILDENYEPSNNESLWMQKSDPVGGVLDTPMEWDIDEDGVYRASFEVEEEGVYSLLIDVASAAGSTSRNNREKQVAFVVTPSLREYSNAGLDASLLERIALASGGKYYNVDAADQLVRDIEYTPNAYSREVQYELWNTPWVLLLLILLLCVDWIARRFRGLS